MKKVQDHYFHKAKADNYPARSVYKLQEIDKQVKLFRPGQKVLDLGAAPGSWTMYAAEKVGPSGRVLGIDLQDTGQAFAANVTFLQDDAFSPSPAAMEILEAMFPLDAVLSDMAPRTTGVVFTDQVRSLELCEQALAVARACLIQGGSFVAKIFMGPDVKAYTDSLRADFAKVVSIKPKSSRSESKEIFVVGLKRLGQPSGLSSLGRTLEG